MLAAAGLVRLGLAARIRSMLSVDESLPAAGQAALGVECLAARGDLLELLGPLEDAETSACVRAERQVNLALGGSCTIPLGAYAEIAGGTGGTGGTIRLRALVASPDGKRTVRAEGEAPLQAAEALGLRVAGLLRERGAGEILAVLAP